jgi:excinuclease ABC subunit C
MFDIHEELKKLPDKPGVYIMKDENGAILYVGKAVVLKNRVRQYFQASANHSPKVLAMVAKVRQFEYIVTDTELEALILECNLIKKHKPRFNILLKDDKNYPYIKITMNDEYPRILMTRRVDRDGAKYFGPYSNVFSVRETINLLKKIFPIKTCKKVLPRDIGKERPCLNYHIKQCMGPCSGNVDREEYRSMMKDICSFLDGRHEDVARRLEERMHAAAGELDFERAASLRNKLTALRHISEEQKVLSVSMADQDVIGLAKDKTDTCIQVFFIRGGKVLGREHFIFEGVGEGETQELLSSFIKQFYGGKGSGIPSEILLQEGMDEAGVLENWLGIVRGGRVRLRIPQRGEKLHLVGMVAQNAEIALQQFRERMAAGGGALREGLSGMAEILGLEELPHRIEAYDISNTGTTEIVASMVVFEDAVPSKKEYRRFRIKSTDVQNDYASMQEVIYRRFKHAEKERQERKEGEQGKQGKQGDGSPVKKQENRPPVSVSSPVSPPADRFSSLPDLILLDGGLGHVNAVRQVLQEMNIGIPAYGMVKDDNHRTRGLVMPDREADIRKNLPVLRMVTAIQDEAHRFAVEYNRKLREKRYSVSILDEIEGIGPKRKKALLKHFGSISRIRQAGLDDLQGVEGVSRAAAEKIFQFFRNESGK